MNPNMDPQQCRRRSLKHRVNKIMRLSNFLSVSLFSFVLVVFFGIAIYLVGVSYSNYTSSQMAYGIGKVMSSTPELLDDFLQQLNPQDGSFNKFDSSALMMENTLAPQQLHDLFNKAMNVANINAIEFRVWDTENHVFFNTVRPEDQKLFDSLWFTDIFTTEVVKEIRDVSGNILGKVGVQLNPFIYLFLIVLIIGLGFFLLIINFIVTNILTLILSNIITKPLSRLKDELDNVASSNIECAISHEIKVKKPVIEVQYLLDATNNIMSKMNEYVATLNFQKDELESQATELESQTEELEAQTEELEAQKDELEAQNATLEERSSSLKFINSAYINRTLKLQNLLNNVGQGFLTISKDQTINPEYSFECEKMILSEHVKKISGMKITDTLFANSNQEEFLHDLIAKIFESDASQKELFLSLMPEELCLNERVLNIQYKLVSDEQQEEVLLIILTDITHTRNLEKQMDEERNNLNMIVKVLLNRGEFIDLVMDYKEFAKKDFHSILEQQKEELLRDIHTYKGSFSQYYLNNTSTFLNELENALYASDGLDQIHIINSSEILDHLESDMETIESYVGQDFLYSDDIYTVKEEKILEIENKIKRILSPSEYQKILPIVKSIRYKSIRELLKTYPDYTMKLSERQSKSIHPVTIDGDDIYIDHLIYQNFSKTLIHMFRNCVDHGIETEDERIELDKPQIATIHCHVETLDEGFTITISDDGRGIDTARLLQIGLNKGLIQEEDIPHMTDEEILSTVFLDGLTTRETVSAISGRGVGLAAVKESVVALGGKISVQSTHGSGTEFKIWLPNLHSTALLTTSPERLLQHIVNASGTVFNSLNLNVADYKFIRTDKIMLNKISALISIKGSLDAILIISVDDVLGKKLVSAFMIDDVDDEQIDGYIEDVLGEISNTILGNVLGLFEEDGVFLSIGVPAMISNKDAYVKYTESQIYSIVFDQEMYSLTMSLLLLDPDHQCIHEADGLPCFFEDVTDFAK